MKIRPSISDRADAYAKGLMATGDDSWQDSRTLLSSSWARGYKAALTDMRRIRSRVGIREREEAMRQLLKPRRGR